MYLILSVILLLLALVALQDWKSRSIWWFLPVLIFAGGIALQYPEIQWMNQLYSFLFVGLLISFLSIYIYFRFGKFDIFKSYFGWGDLLILVALIPFFEFRDYIFFFTLATIVSLVLHGIVSLFKKQTSVPYAGYVSLALLTHLSCFYFFHLSVFKLIHV